jgi:hypothetical protein
MISGRAGGFSEATVPIPLFEVGLEDWKGVVGCGFVSPLAARLIKNTCLENDVVPEAHLGLDRRRIPSFDSDCSPGP